MYKHQLQTEQQNLVTVSEYDDNDSKQLLPIKAVTRKYDEKGKMTREVTFTQTKATFGILVDPKIFTIAGLDLPVGEPVVDERIGRRLGYWNGEEPIEDLKEAMLHKQDKLLETSPITEPQWFLWTVPVLFIALLVLSYIYYRRGQIRKN